MMYKESQSESSQSLFTRLPNRIAIQFKHGEIAKKKVLKTLGISEGVLQPEQVVDCVKISRRSRHQLLLTQGQHANRLLIVISGSILGFRKNSSSQMGLPTNLPAEDIQFIRASREQFGALDNIQELRNQLIGSYSLITKQGEPSSVFTLHECIVAEITGLLLDLALSKLALEYQQLHSFFFRHYPSLVSDMTDKNIFAAFKLMHTSCVKSGTTIYEEGSPQSDMLLLLHGQVIIVKTNPDCTKFPVAAIQTPGSVVSYCKRKHSNYLHDYSAHCHVLCRFIVILDKHYHKLPQHWKYYFQRMRKMQFQRTKYRSERYFNSLKARSMYSPAKAISAVSSMSISEAKKQLPYALTSYHMRKIQSLQKLQKVVKVQSMLNSSKKKLVKLGTRRRLANRILAFQKAKAEQGDQQLKAKSLSAFQVIKRKFYKACQTHY